MSDTPPVPRPRRVRATTGTTDPTGTGTHDAAENGGIGGNGGADPGPASAPRPRAGRATKMDKLEDKLSMFFSSFSLAFAAAGDDYCAQIVAARSPALASAWAELARENTQVRRVLERLMEGGAWGGVAFSTMAIVLPVASHHGLIPTRIGDPFANFLPGPPAPGDGRRPSAQSGGAGEGDPWKRPMGSTSTRRRRSRVVREDPPGGQTSPTDQSTTNGSRDVEDIPVYQEGAPPGVVTVANGPAGHSGAAA